MNWRVFLLTVSLLALILSIFVSSWQLFLISLIAVLAITFSFYIKGVLGLILYYIGAIITVIGLIIALLALVLGFVVVISLI